MGTPDGTAGGQRENNDIQTEVGRVGITLPGNVRKPALVFDRLGILSRRHRFDWAIIEGGEKTCQGAGRERNGRPTVATSGRFSGL